MPVTAPAPLPGQLSGNHEPLIPEGLEHEPGGRVGLWQPGDIGDQLAQRRISPVAEAICRPSRVSVDATVGHASGNDMMTETEQGRGVSGTRRSAGLSRPDS